MCITPSVDNVETRKSFHFLSSSACCLVYSTLLVTLLCVVNTQVYTEEHWQSFYLNPSIPEELEKLNYLIVSLIVAGAVSIIGYRIISSVKVCEDVVEKMHDDEDSESEDVEMEPMMADRTDSEVEEKAPDHGESEDDETVRGHDDDDESNTMENAPNQDFEQFAQDITDSEGVEKEPDRADYDSEVAEIEMVHGREDCAVMDMNDHGDSDFILKVENHDDSKIVEKERQDDDVLNDDLELANEMIKQ